MSDWQVQDAIARFSELLNITLKHGPQIVTRRGILAAALVPISEWRRLRESSRPSLKTLLVELGPRFDNLIPARGKLRRRTPRELA